MTPIIASLLRFIRHDLRIYKISALLELFPRIFNKIQSNQSVLAFFDKIVPYVVPQLVLQRRLDIIVDALDQSVILFLLQLGFTLTILIRVTDTSVVQLFLEQTCARIEISNGSEKDMFIAEPFFVAVIGDYLKGNDAATRRYASTIIDLLSKGVRERS